MRLTVIAITLAILGGSAAARAAPVQAVFSRTKAALTREIEETLVDTGIPSISIALFDEQRVIWARAFGYSNVALKVPASPETIYSTGSCFKPVTAMAVMQLVDRGELNLDDPINDYLGELRIAAVTPDAPPVTFRHLLGHYSGLKVKGEGEARGAQAVPLWDRRLPKSLEEMAAELYAAEPPGKRYRYSNYAYALAGLLIERISGQSYERYIVENILRPVGVELDGPVHPTPAMIEQLALPYRLENNRAVAVRQARLDVYPAGDIYLSAPAMARVMLTHLNGGKHGSTSILSEAAVEEMRKPQFGGTDGLDFGIKKADGERLIMHGGGVQGFSTKCILAVDSKVGVYVAANASRAQLPLRILAQLALDLLRGKQIGSGLVREHVGVGIAPVADEQSGLLRISQVFPKSPASRAGLASGLLIGKIDGTPVEDKSLKDCLRMLGGSIGTTVQLEVVESTGNKARTVELKRGPFWTPS